MDESTAGDAHLDFTGQMGSTDASENDIMDLDDWMPNQTGLDAEMQSFYNDFSLDKPSFFNNSERLTMFSLPNNMQRSHAAPAEKQLSTQAVAFNSSQWRERPNTTTSAKPQVPMYHEPMMSWDSLFSSQAGNFTTGSAAKKATADDDDAASCDSSCEGSCPSQCGEEGHGVVCDNDDCAPPGLCHDQECLAATHPCTDEDCVGELCSGETCEGNVCKGESCRIDAPPDQRVPDRPMTDKDKAAAAALASIGDDQLPAGHQNLSQLSHMAPASSTHGFQGHLPLPENLSDLSMGMSFPDFDHVNDGPWPSAEQFLASHILQYHNPDQALAHERPCVANHPSQLVSRCSLPRFYPNDAMSADTFSSHTDCGFLVQDPTDFRNHIFEEHQEALMNPLFRMGQATTSHHQGNMMPYSFQFCNGPASTYQMNMASTPAQTSSGSIPPSPLTSMSMGNTAHTTPASPMTPPSAKEPTPSLPVAGLAIKLEEHGGLSTPRIKSQTVETICRWVQPGGTTICGQEFKTEESLHNHCKECHLKTIQKSDGGFNCMWEGCVRDKNFPQRSKLDRHLQTHTLYKPAQCPECGQWLSAQQALVQHMRTHTGQEPWKCPWEGCTSTFKQQSALTMHLRAHTGEKPLECEICGKRFSESSNLSKHRRIHNRKGQHMCGICGKDFHRLDQLRRHLGSNHKDQPAEASKLLCKAEEEGRGRGRGRGVRQSEDLS